MEQFLRYTTGFQLILLLPFPQIHEFVDDRNDKSRYKSNFAFRLIYNGQVLTHRMGGCPSNSELCDAKVLVNHMQKFATRFVDCAEDSRVDGDAVWKTIKSLISKTGGLVLVLCIMAFSATIGSATMFFYLTGKLPDAAAALRAHQAKSRNKKKFSYFGDKAEGASGAREGAGLVDEIEMSFTNASNPSDEDWD